MARGFRAPQATELYRLQRAQQITDLDSESIDSGAGLYRQHRLTELQVAAYHMEKDHVIFRDSSFFNVSDGKTEHQGIELELDYEINHNGALGHQCNPGSPYLPQQYLVGGVDIRGNDIDTAPRHFGSAPTGMDTRDRTEPVELEWQSMGSYYLNPENFHQLRGA